MSEIEKFFKLFDKKENIESFLETEKENTIFKSVSFMKKILKVLIKDNKLECNHSIEDICAYFENNLSKDEKEKIKERIFSCDSCFNTYNYLKSQIKLEKVKTPNTLLDKVLMGGTSFLFDIFNSLKTSNLKLSLGASFALIIAVMFSLPMFYTSQKNLDVMPANESKLDLSTAKKDKESFKISQSLQKPKPQEPSVLSRSVSPLATVKSEKIFIPKQV